MSNARDLRRIALALPEAYEDLHRRLPAFRVRGRIFAMLGVVGEAGLFPELASEDIAVLKLAREEQLNMIAAFANAVRPTETYGHHGWTYVRLSGVDEESLTRLLRLAWTHVAPKVLSRRL